MSRSKNWFTSARQWLPAAGCKPCTNYHFKQVRAAGASDDEIEQAISDAMCVRDSAKAIMESFGLKLLGIAREDGACGCTDGTTRIRELVSIAAAFAVNCTASLNKHMAAGRSVGIADDEIKAVLEMALFVKGKAASHVNRIAERMGAVVSSGEEPQDPAGCDGDDEPDGSHEEGPADGGTRGCDGGSEGDG